MGSAAGFFYATRRRVPLLPQRLLDMPTSTASDRCGAFAVALAAASLGTGPLCAQTPLAPATPAPTPDTTLDPVTVTATRGAERLFDVPASADVIDRATIRNGQPAINLSESLVRVPGIFAANRNNYAQDLQLSSRGYGARATFGVRGVRLYQDDIPATMPDGQGQTGSFSLLSAQSIEVLRGPFSTSTAMPPGGWFRCIRRMARRAGGRISRAVSAATARRWSA